MAAVQSEVRPNVIVLNNLMSAFARSWRYNELAWSTFESMEGVGVTVSFLLPLHFTRIVLTI